MENLIIAAVFTLAFFRHRQICEALERFRGNFPRGGPPTHPLPAADAALLKRRLPAG